MKTCQFCEQGEVVTAKVRATGKMIYICDECDAVSQSKSELEKGVAVGFWKFAESYGGKGLWEEIEVLGN